MLCPFFVALIVVEIFVLNSIVRCKYIFVIVHGGDYSSNQRLRPRNTPVFTLGLQVQYTEKMYSRIYYNNS